MPESKPESQTQSQPACDHNHKHSHHHPHHHHHGHGSASRNLGIALALNLSFSLIELIGGFWAGSMAIVAGAIHDFGDAVSLGSAWLLEKMANRRRDQVFNFGYRRFSLLSALISGVVISTGSVLIVVRALGAAHEHDTPETSAMIALALLGVVINTAAALQLHRGATQNERIMTWHQIEDIASWIVVLIAGVVLKFWHLPWLDPVLAIAQIGRAHV